MKPNLEAPVSGFRRIWLQSVNTDVLCHGHTGKQDTLC